MTKITLEKIKEEQEKVNELVRRYEEQEQEKKKDSYELEYPDIEDVDYFYIGNSGGIFKTNWTGNSFDKGRWEIGNGFPSFELAEKKEKQEILITRFNQFRDKFHVGNETIDNLVRDGHISKSKFGRKYFYDVREINKYLDSKKEFC